MLILFTKLVLSARYTYPLYFRFGMGKQNLENKVIEETSYLIEEIRQKNGEAFDASASNVRLLNW